MAREMKLLFLTLTIMAASCLLSEDFLNEVDEAQAFLRATNYINFPDYVTYMGYPNAQYQVTTSDGYYIQVFRLQSKSQNEIVNGLPVVFLMHGLFDTSDTWVVNNETLAPAFLLANAGYDVWSGNVRGNKYCLTGVNFNKKDDKFWDFTWDDMSAYDLPAQLQFVYKTTGQKINYVGHSQGTTIMFAALASQNTAVSSVLQSFSALGPVTFVQNTTSEMTNFLLPIINLFPIFGTKYIFLNSITQSLVRSLICQFFDDDCTQLLKMYSDADVAEDNTQRLDYVAAYFPSSTSTLNVLHWQQMIEYEEYKFQMYDYGTQGNIQNYGQSTPPVYNLGNIEMPVNLFVGGADKLADPSDAQILKTMLTGSSSVNWFYYENYGHATFVWGKEEVYVNDLIGIINSAEAAAAAKN